MGALYNTVSSGLAAAGNAISEMGSGVMDYYTMPDKGVFKEDYINEMRNQYKEFGQDVTESDLARFGEEAGKLFSEEDKQKKLRRGATGALLGGLYGYADHKANAGVPNRGPSVLTSQAPTGTGSLGTGYNPFKK